MDYDKLLKKLREAAKTHYFEGTLTRFCTLLLLERHEQTVRRFYESNAATRGLYTSQPFIVNVNRGTRRLSFVLKIIPVPALPNGQDFIFCPHPADTYPYAGHEVAVANSSVRRLLGLHHLIVRESNPLTGGVLVDGKEVLHARFEEVLEIAERLYQSGVYDIPHPNFTRMLRTLPWERNDPQLAEFRLTRFDYNVHSAGYDAFTDALREELAKLAKRSHVAYKPAASWDPNSVRMYDLEAAQDKDRSMRSMSGRLYMSRLGNIFVVYGIYRDGYDVCQPVLIPLMSKSDPLAFFVAAQEHFLPKEIADFLKRHGHTIDRETVKKADTSDNWNYPPDISRIGLLIAQNRPGGGGSMSARFIGTRGRIVEVTVKSDAQERRWRDIVETHFPLGWAGWKETQYQRQPSVGVEFS